MGNTPSVRRGGAEESLQRPETVAAIDIWDQIVVRAEVLRGVEPGAVSALKEQLRKSESGAGQLISIEGDPDDRLFIMGSGKVKVSLRPPGGREHLLANLVLSEVFGGPAVFDLGPLTCTATALTDVKAVWLDGDTLRSWIADTRHYG